jgi:hypothetical protein
MWNLKEFLQHYEHWINKMISDANFRCHSPGQSMWWSAFIPSRSHFKRNRTFGSLGKSANDRDAIADGMDPSALSAALELRNASLITFSILFWYACDHQHWNTRILPKIEKQNCRFRRIGNGDESRSPTASWQSCVRRAGIKIRHCQTGVFSAPDMTGNDARPDPVHMSCDFR